MFEEGEDSRATAENNALDDMMANMLTVSEDEGGIVGGARAAVSTVSGGENKKKKKNNLTADEVEQASALKSWADADLSDSMEETKRSPKPRRKKGRGGKRGRNKRSPRSSGGKSLLRPHGGAPTDSGGGGCVVSYNYFVCFFCACLYHQRYIYSITCSISYIYIYQLLFSMDTLFSLFF